MGRNKKEAFIFTSIMCVFMVLIMSFYNVILINGFSNTLLKEVAVGFFPALVVALILDVFVVGKIAKGLAHRILKESSPLIQKVLLISFFMVSGMAMSMSFFGTVMHYGFSGDILSHYLPTFGHNFIFALPLQLVLVGPLTRFLFMKIYPAPAPSHAFAK
jgi:hypothetical protein